MRRLLLICLYCFIFLNSDAQRFRSEIQVGVVGSQVSGDDLSGFDKAGFLGGIGVRTDLKKKCSIGFKILYLQKGSRKPSKLDQGDPTYYLLQLNYLEVPIQFRYLIGKKIYVEAGPSFAYLVKSKEQDEDGELTSRDPFSKFDFSIAGAIAYSLSKQWNIRFEAWQSLLPVRKHSNGNTYRLNQGQYNSVIALGIQYTIKLAHH